MNLPELIELSETDKFVENLLDRAVKNVFGNRKPLTEILDNIDKDE